MSKAYKHFFWYLTFVIAYGIAIFVVVNLAGCLQPLPNGNSQLHDSTLFAPEWLNAMIEIAQAISLANTASVTVNPYAGPIQIGLVGLIAVLEALRRKEKSGRKHAEGVVNGNNKPT